MINPACQRSLRYGLKVQRRNLLRGPRPTSLPHVHLIQQQPISQAGCFAPNIVTLMTLEMMQSTKLDRSRHHLARINALMFRFSDDLRRPLRTRNRLCARDAALRRQLGSKRIQQNAIRFFLRERPVV